MITLLFVLPVPARASCRSNSGMAKPPTASVPIFRKDRRAWRSQKPRVGFPQIVSIGQDFQSRFGGKLGEGFDLCIDRSLAQYTG